MFCFNLYIKWQKETPPKIRIGKRKINIIREKWLKDHLALLLDGCLGLETKSVLPLYLTDEIVGNFQQGEFRDENLKELQTTTTKK